jgi:ankyrin repeat protein
VQAALARDPDLMAKLAPHDHRMMHDAAREGRTAALALMAELGFDLAARDDMDGATPLHWACLQGTAGAVKVLVEKGAPLDPDDARYHAPPIGWTAHGSLHTQNPAGDYVACARILISAGAKVPPHTQGSEEVMAVLRDHRLREAIRQGNVEQARAPLKEGADSNYRADDGTVPLHLAARAGSGEMVALLLSHGARQWVPDNNGKRPADCAKERDESPDKAEVLAIFNSPRIQDANFRRAVDAMTTGDLGTLQRLLREHPGLARARAEEDGEYAGSYFARPFLLEFVPENPVRSGNLPPNVCEIAQAIIDAGAPRGAIAKTLGLAASGRVARECGVQAELLELLVRNGADPTPALDAAIGEGEWAAAETLLRLGARPGLYAAAGLGRGEQVKEMLSRPRAAEELARAADGAIRGGHVACVRLLLEVGLAADARAPGHPYAATLLHQAAFAGEGAIVELLLERGADPRVTDTQFHGTAADWAKHAGHSDLEARLRDAEGTTGRT